MRLDNKIAVVTGASKGIGAAIATGLASEGADVVVNYNSDIAGANKTVEKIEETGRKAVAIKADISHWENAAALVQNTVEHFGRIDILVNNAAVPCWKPIFEVDEKLWNSVIDTNLKGTFVCSLEAAKHMREQNSGGSIINIGSGASTHALRYLAPYCASKGGISMLTKEMAMELGEHTIRVNCICPGSIIVDRNLKDDPDYNETWKPFVPLRRVGLVQDIVGPVLFLASDEAAYVTGQIFDVDGGWLACAPQPVHEHVIATKAKV